MYKDVSDCLCASAVKSVGLMTPLSLPTGSNETAALCPTWCVRRVRTSCQHHFHLLGTGLLPPICFAYLSWM